MRETRTGWRSLLDSAVTFSDKQRCRRSLLGNDMFQSFFKCINDLSQIDAAELVLRRLGRPVDLTRLVVEMLERGFVPVNGKMGFKKSMRSATGRSSRFVEDGGLWANG